MSTPPGKAQCTLSREAASQGWTAAQHRLPGGARPVLVAGAESQRRSLLLVNSGTTTIWLNSSDTDTGTGWPLVPGEGLTLATAARVFAHAPAGDGAVKVLTEYGAV